jgi:hypothetical protein
VKPDRRIAVRNLQHIRTEQGQILLDGMTVLIPLGDILLAVYCRSRRGCQVIKVLLEHCQLNRRRRLNRSRSVHIREYRQATRQKAGDLDTAEFIRNCKFSGQRVRHRIFPSFFSVFKRLDRLEPSRSMPPSVI